MAARASYAGERLAVLLATFEGARFLDAQLRSVESQTWPAIDVFASDDSSTDDTPQQLVDWQSRWRKGVFVVSSAPRRGFAGNFRWLLINSEVDAAYVAFCDQDDIWLPQKTSVAAAALAPFADRPALYCARTLITDADDHPLAISPRFRRTPEFANALVQSIGGGNTMVMNRAAHALVREAARRTDFVSHDWFSYMLVSGAGGSVIFSDTPHVRYRQHGNNLVGANRGLGAKLKRLQLALGGRFSRWLDLNMRAIAACQDLLTPEARTVYDQFCAAARHHSPVSRLIGLRRSGVYRQTMIGQLSLYLAGLLGKL
jgi:glycosyltransferase involved in cell wall biosynthesis